MNQEQKYDEMISPLVKQIVAICMAEKIPCIMSFACPNDEPEIGEGLRCTTYINPPGFLGKTGGFREALRALKRDDTAFSMAISVTQEVAPT